MVKVVIGSAWGDCGKGLMTDYLSNEDTLVCRFNGGSQAGHTVQSPEGYRHVFHHFGSGTLRGARTLLARDFICNPYTFETEYRLLVENNITPYVKYHSVCRLTTPYDMMINQMVEEHRANSRHGSCGIGINETIKRSEQYHWLSMLDISHARFSDMLKSIRVEWVPRRLERLGVPISDDWQRRLNDSHIIDEYIDKTKSMVEKSHATDDRLEIHMSSHVVFEGAQGLLLDQNNMEFFPHLTPSNTGLQNVVQFVGTNTPLDVVYVTRAYATRHGAGPFARETTDISYQDKTNVPNMWQNSLRFGHLDIDLLTQTIKKDLEHGRNHNIKPCIAVTCLDQVGDIITYYLNDMQIKSTREVFLNVIESTTGIPVKYISEGPTRDHVSKR